MSEKTFRQIVEFSVFPLLLLAIIVWGNELDWEFDKLEPVLVFPLLGLIAFTTMWWHFLIGFIRQIKPDFAKMKQLHKISGYWVFVAIVMHPVLLWMWGFDNGASSIPEAVKDYTGGSNYRFAMLGTFGLTVFILFDLARWLRERAWVKKWWWLIDTIDDAAFLIIWIHAYNLGTHTQEGWYGWLWILYGLSGLFFIIYKHLKSPDHVHLAKT